MGAGNDPDSPEQTLDGILFNVEVRTGHDGKIVVWGMTPGSPCP